MVFSSVLLLAQEGSSPSTNDVDNTGQQQEEQKPETADKTDDSAKGQGDFKPQEEISEDYPVPLPADI